MCQHVQALALTLVCGAWPWRWWPQESYRRILAQEQTEHMAATKSFISRLDTFKDLPDAAQVKLCAVLQRRVFSLGAYTPCKPVHSLLAAQHCGRLNFDVRGHCLHDGQAPSFNARRRNWTASSSSWYSSVATAKCYVASRATSKLTHQRAPRPTSRAWMRRTQCSCALCRQGR